MRCAWFLLSCLGDSWGAVCYTWSHLKDWQLKQNKSLVLVLCTVLCVERKRRRKCIEFIPCHFYCTTSIWERERERYCLSEYFPTFYFILDLELVSIPILKQRSLILFVIYLFLLTVHESRIFHREFQSFFFFKIKSRLRDWVGWVKWFKIGYFRHFT